MPGRPACGGAGFARRFGPRPFHDAKLAMASQAPSPRSVEDCHELLRWIIPHLDRFPRLRRFTLGERIESGLLQVLESLTEAAYGRGPVALEALTVANRRLQGVRHLWRLAHELGVVGRDRFAFGAERMVSLGRQIGGWRRALSPPAAAPS
jgi:hypothetical protein